MAEDCEKNQRRKWSIGREVPLATVAVLLAQTVGVIWWAASITAKVESVEKSAASTVLIQAVTDSKQDSDARRSEDRVVVQLDKVNVKIDRLIEMKR